MTHTERFPWARRRPPMRPVLALEPLIAALADDVPRWHGAEVEPELIRARLADRYRDARLMPLPPEEFDHLALGLDAEAWRRLALVVSALDGDAVRREVEQRLADLTGPFALSASVRVRDDGERVQ